MFEIVITKRENMVETRGKDWELIGKEKDAEYGYTPEIEKEVEVTIKILEQNVEELDLPAVIKAINKL